MRRTTACYEHWADADISFEGSKEKTAWCLPALISMAPLHFAFLCAIISRPPSPCFRLKTLSISRQPTFLMACCYRRTFPPVFLKWQSSTPFERYFQKGLMMAAAWTVMAAARWMANIDAAGFVLIKSSCISWSRTPASRSATAYSEHGADAHISFMPKEKCAGCLPKLFIISTPDHPPRTVFLYPLGLLRRLSDGKTAISYWRLSPVQR